MRVVLLSSFNGLYVCVVQSVTCGTSPVADSDELFLGEVRVAVYIIYMRVAVMSHMSRPF